MTELTKIDNNNNLDMSRERIDLIKRTYCKGSTDDEFQLFINVCNRTGLSPEARQVYAVKRWDSKARREVMSIQTSIDGFRLIAERTGKYTGQLGPFWCGEDGEWKDVWLSNDPPVAAKVGALRSDFTEPAWAVVRFKAYAQTMKSGELTQFWRKMGDLMIAKCAESLALRKAFPQELSGLYTQDEMSQTTEHTQEQMSPPPTSSNESGKAIEPEVIDAPSISERGSKMLSAFIAAHGVDQHQIEKFIGKPMSEFIDKDFANLKEIYQSLRAGTMKTNEIFAPELGENAGVKSKLEGAFAPN